MRASTDAILNSYRVAISDDTNSRALYVRVLARKPRLSNGLRVPTICPPTRRSCGAETLRLSALSSSLLKIVKRRVSVGYAEVGVGKWWARKKILDQLNTNRFRKNSPERRAFHGRIHQGRGLSWSRKVPGSNWNVRPKSIGRELNLARSEQPTASVSGVCGWCGSKKNELVAFL